MKQRLAVDMDQVMCDLLNPWLERYNNDYNDDLKPSDITSWNFHHIVKPECGEKIYTYLDDQELFRTLPVMDNSQEVLYGLSKQFDIFVVTAPWNPYNMATKHIYLKKHFEFIDERNFVFTRNKGIINADYLIDDKPSNFDTFRGIALLYDAPHNQSEIRYTRVMNWLDIKKYFNV